MKRGVQFNAVIREKLEDYCIAVRVETAVVEWKTSFITLYASVMNFARRLGTVVSTSKTLRSLVVWEMVSAA